MKPDHCYKKNQPLGLNWKNISKHLGGMIRKLRWPAVREQIKMTFSHLFDF